MNFFPLFIDSLILQPCIEDTCIYYDDSENFGNSIEKLSLEYINDELGENFIENIDSIQYIPMEVNDNRVKLIKFYSQNDSLWVGRVVDFQLPLPIINADGDVETPGIATISSNIDPIQIDMINQTESSGTRYINSLIQIQNTFDLKVNYISNY